MRRVCIAAGLSKLAGVDASEEEVNAAVASTVPLGKVGAKWDIAIAAVFLCSSAARHLTGAVTAPAKLAMGVAGTCRKGQRACCGEAKQFMKRCGTACA